MTNTVVCIKWGTKYGSDYVNRLQEGLKRGLSKPFRLICLTDNGEGISDEVIIRPLPESGLDEDAMDSKKGGETWRKVGLFMPGVLEVEGDVLYLDLDVVLMGNLDRFFEYEPGSFCVIHDWLEKRRGKKGGNTSVVRFNPEKHQNIYHYYREHQAVVLGRWRIEQQYVTWAAMEQCGGAKYWPTDWVASYKRSCRPVFPLNYVLTPSPPKEDCSILVFHGYPTPEQAVSGYGTGVKKVLPAAWLREYWEG